jgi:hypothetical protein
MGVTSEGSTQVLSLLRQIGERLDGLIGDVRDLSVRTSAIDKHLSGFALALSGTNHRLDRIDARVARIERRLDLTDAHDAR